jgi:hypothetical protein
MPSNSRSKLDLYFRGPTDEEILAEIDKAEAGDPRDPDTIVLKASESPTLRRWAKEHAEEQKAREAHRHEIRAEAERRLEEEEKDARREAEVQQQMSQIRRPW